MYIPLATASLKTGVEMEVGVVQAPDSEYGDQIRKFLGHKPDTFLRHIDQCLEGPLDKLETRFYVGVFNGRVIAQVMIVEYAGVGLLGHVFTQPEHRQKGACRAVMAQQMEDFRRRGGQSLLLGTGFESPPYWLYHSFGFRSLTGDSGFMSYTASEDFEARWFAPRPMQVVDMRWHHWPTLSYLFGQKAGDFLRNVAWGVLGQRNFEGGFLSFRETLEEQQARGGKPLHQAKLLETETGAVVGCATIWPDPQWPGTSLLDVFVHPHFEAGIESLLGSLDAPGTKTLAYTEAQARAKNRALEGTGFRLEGTLSRQLCRPGGPPEDVLLWGRWS